MKILSHQEGEFLRNPQKFKQGYSRVLKHRIRKKVEDMVNVLVYIAEHDKGSLKLEKTSIFGFSGSFATEGQLRDFLNAREHEGMGRMIKELYSINSKQGQAVKD